MEGFEIRAFSKIGSICSFHMRSLNFPNPFQSLIIISRLYLKLGEILISRPRKGVKHYLELEARLDSIIEKINYGVSLVIVEGNNDKAALIRIGIKSPIMGFSNSGLPIFAFVEEIVKDYRGLTVVVLLDFDKEGTRMADRLSRELEEKGVKVDRFYRRTLGELLAKEGIRRIEDIHILKLKAHY